MDDVSWFTSGELASMLVDGRRQRDRAEAEWLAWLAEFDVQGGWAIYGCRSCVNWLVQHCGMNRVTAKDKLRIALQLRQRPVLRDALVSGRLSYSKIRALTRIRYISDEYDEENAAKGEVLTADDIEQMVRHAKAIEDQDKPPSRLEERCGVRMVCEYGGYGTIEVRAPLEDTERIMRIVNLAVESTARGEAVDTAVSTGTDDAGNPLPRPGWGQRRVGELIDLLEAGLERLGQGGHINPQRAVVNVVVDYDTLVERAPGSATLDGGGVVTGETARMLACDAGLCRIITKGASEVLDVGRDEREWNPARRRAILFRHDYQCAWPGCGRRILPVHHAKPWDDKGPTNIDNGVPLCAYHHGLMHYGKWSVHYSAEQQAAIFTGPNDQIVTSPARPRSQRTAA